jgi:hypothetical protein
MTCGIESKSSVIQMRRNCITLPQARQWVAIE